MKNKGILLMAIIMFSCGGIVKNIKAKDNKDKEESYYLNGQLEFSYQLKDGARNGPSVAYYQDGTLWCESNWKDGKLHGKSKTYMPNGELELEEVWSNRQLMEKKIYWQKAGKEGYLFVSKDGFYTMKGGKMVELDETTPDNVIEEVYSSKNGPTYFIWKGGKREPWQ